MDFSTLKPLSEGAVMVVRHPATNAPIDGTTITLLGMDSERAQRMVRAATNRRLKTGVQRMKLTAEELEADELDGLAAVTVAWTDIELKGEALPCTAENARKLYAEYRWLREQVSEFVKERANFLPGCQEI